MQSPQRTLKKGIILGWIFLQIFMPASFPGTAQYTTFLVSPNQNLTGAVECPFITFQAWDGSLWNAWIIGDRIVVSPNGNLFPLHHDDGICFVDAEGKPFSASFDSGKLSLTSKGEATPTASVDSFSYRSWDGRPIYARLIPPPSPTTSTATTASTARHIGPRFVFQDGEITDWKTNLVWKEGPDTDTNFNEAQAWIKSQGNGWRRPTQSELRNLFSRGEGGGLKGNMPAAFPKLSGTVAWAEENDAATAWFVGFIYANCYTLGRENRRFARVIAVRPRGDL